jgi:hypothetical protein
MPDRFGVHITGLRELDRALGRADKTLRTDLRNRLKAVAGVVSVEARGIASSKGLHVSGDLIRGISPFALTGRTGVRSTAKHGGYPYPLRLEYEGRSGGRFGPHATLIPAFERHEEDVARGAEQVLTDIERDWSKA